MNDEFQKCFQMLNMEWEKRLQYICGKCWQHIWEFHQFEESIIEAQKGQHLHTEAAKEVKIKPELNLHINQQEVQLELSANTEESTKPPALTFDIKTEEPLDLNSDHEGISPQDEQDHLTNEEMLLTMPSRKDNSTLRNDDESNEDYCSNDDIPLTSLGHTNLFSLENKVSATNRLVEEFDELVALWRSSLECEICHQLVVSYSQLKEHFSKHHASEGCYLMCCKLRLETRYDIENHIRYHNAPQQLKCEACCKAFRLVTYLRKHYKIVHTGRGGDKNAKDNKKLEGKYGCCKCSKDFATEKQLNQHNLDVHKPKIYKCNVCEKTFMRPYALREHLAGHKGKQPHACSVCSKAFTWRSNFCQHMRKSHPQEWQKMQDEEAQREREKYRYRRETRGNGMVYVCIYCFKEYDSRFSMYYHAKRCQMYNTPKEPKKGFRLNTREEQAEQISMISEPTAPAEKVDIKPELNKNRQEIQQEVVLHNAIGLSASTEDSIKPSDLNFDIKSEEPLDLNSDHEEMSPQDGQDHLTDEEMSLMMSSRQENSSLQSDNKSKEDYYSNDDLPSSSLGQIKHCTSDKCTSATKKSAEEFDEVVALWRSPLECENCHQLVASYSQLKEHFSKYHASERCYLMCCQMRLETRYDIENHIGYHNAPQQL
uniref:C2H2-type domain-containing protein n=1 Tax=Stomoxys calcitrans TaxID=35570 RepID=A0A1I8Q1M2_STOCA